MYSKKPRAWSKVMACHSKYTQLPSGERVELVMVGETLGAMEREGGVSEGGREERGGEEGREEGREGVEGEREKEGGREGGRKGV